MILDLIEKWEKRQTRTETRRAREEEEKEKEKERKRKKNMLYVVGQEIQDNMISLFNERKEKYEDDFLDNNYWWRD